MPPALRLSIGVLLLAIANGCRTFVPHPWTQESRHAPATVEPIGASRLSRVKPAAVAAAVARLTSVSVVELLPAEYAALAATPSEWGPGDRAYLVRGISWGRPWFTRVSLDPERGLLYVVQYTYNGEIYIPGRYESGPNPVLVLLDQPIGDVCPDAVWGGDWIARFGLDPEFAWQD